jgi:hypothetical protein
MNPAIICSFILGYLVGHWRHEQQFGGQQRAGFVARINNLTVTVLVGSPPARGIPGAISNPIKTALSTLKLPARRPGG